MLPAVSAIALRIARWTYFGVRASGASNGRPIHWMRTFSSLSSCDAAEQLGVQAEDVADLGAGADPVLGREAEDRQPADVAAHRDAHEAGEVLLALGVALGAGQAAPPGPAPVAVHDARDVQARPTARGGPSQASTLRRAHPAPATSADTWVRSGVPSRDAPRRRGSVAGSSLAHVMVVGGTRRVGGSPTSVADLARALGAVVADAGGAWLTIRAYEAGDTAGADDRRRAARW